MQLKILSLNLTFTANLNLILAILVSHHHFLRRQSHVKDTVGFHLMVLSFLLMGNGSGNVLIVSNFSFLHF